MSHVGNTFARSGERNLIGQIILVCAFFCFGVVAGEVTSFTLVNASTNSDIQVLNDGATIDLGTTGSSLNIRANISGTTAKVNFTLSGAQSHTQSEGVAPYALFGDSSGNYNSWTPVAGNYSLTANCDGAGAKTVNFTVTDDGGDPPPPPPPSGDDGDGTVTISANPMQWHRVDLKQLAKDSSEMGNPNPFLDYRMNVTFTAPSGKKYVVPGYFATDGQGGDSGNVWLAHLNPDETGNWSYSVSFRSGTDVAVSTAATPGTAVSPFDGKSGNFTVTASDKSGKDFRAADKGMLVNRGHHYLTYGGSGKPFLYTGPGIPENILGYNGFTNSTAGTGHNFNAHAGHWNTGDPDWNSGAGRKLIGALNYISDQGANCLYMMSNTIGGDGKDCFPHPTTTTTKDRYDLLKLIQWDIALAHAQKKGIFLHWHLSEHEAPNREYYGMSDNTMTVERKLSFRMLNAVFGHYNGLKWNIAEECEFSASQRTAQMEYIKAVDPYDHPVTYQVGGAGIAFSTYDSHTGQTNGIDAGSFQGGDSRGTMFNRMQEWRNKSAANGVKWTCAWDEPQKIENDNNDEVNGYPMGRRDKMWPCLMGGGDGFMWYIQKDGGGHGFDQTIEDFTIMKNAFNWSGHIRTFLQDLPLVDMQSSLSIVSSSTGTDYTLYKAGEVYAIFNDRAGNGMSLDLSGQSGTFTVKWFDPRNGGDLQNGSVTTVTGGGSRSLGSAPSSTGEDWAVLVQKQTGGNQAPNASITAPQQGAQFDEGDSITITATASDSDGTVTKVEFFADGSKIGEDSSSPYSVVWNGAAIGAHSLTAVATDNDNDTGSSGAVSISVTADLIIGTGTGLTGEYYDNMDFTTLKVTRVDETVNFNWGTGSPDASVGADSFSVRWTGEVEPMHQSGTATYKFTTRSDDGVRLWVNGQLIVENWTNHAPTDNSGSIVLAAGQKYDIKMEYYENGGGAVAQLSWEVAGLITKQIVPKTQLYPVPVAPTNQAPVVNAGTDATIQLPTSQVSLNCTVTDDGLPEGASVSSAWSKVSGPGTVTFGNAANVDTTATFSAAGTYVLRLTADDTELSASDDVQVTVEEEPVVGTVVKAINCGGGAYTATDGTDYVADVHFNAGNTYSTTAAITGTTDDTLYKSERWYSGNLIYSIPVANGDYLVTLKFAEIWATSVGQRVFDVKVEGGLVVDELDIFSKVGKNAAHDVTVGVTVSDGNLTIELAKGTANNPKISAILVETDGGSETNEPPAAEAGADQTIQLPTNSVNLDGTVTDDDLPNGSLSTQWTKVSGPGTVTFANAGSVDTTAAFSAAGTYVLRLTADDTELLASDEVTITVEAAPVNQAPNVTAGADQTIQLPNGATLNGTVTDDGLPQGAAFTTTWSKASGPGTVSFGNAANVGTTATFSAAGTYVLRLTADDTELLASDEVTITVEEEPVVGGQVVAAINCGGAAFTAGDGTQYSADVNFNAGKAYSTGSAIAGTADDALYKSERWYAGKLTYAIPVANGQYEVTLKFAEIYFSVAGKRVFDIDVEGGQVTDNLDIWSQVGKNAAHDVTTTVTVTDGVLTIDLLKQVENPKISAILVKTAP